MEHSLKPFLQTTLDKINISIKKIQTEKVSLEKIINDLDSTLEEIEDVEETLDNAVVEIEDAISTIDSLKYLKE